jgi:branched-chain amino acid transport system ATP-binding protein
MPDVLRLTGVTAGYGSTTVLEDVSFSLAQGTGLAVLGRNGVGKTTLMRTIAGHTQLRSGRIELGDREIGRAPAWARARGGLGYVPQERDIFSSLTVLENLTVGARPGAWSEARIFEVFPPLAARRNNRGNQLSGGEQQMLSIARALALQPTILLLDEPFEGLAPNLVEMLAATFRELRRSGLSIVLVEQHARLALSITDDAIVLVRGRVVLHRGSRALLDAPNLLEETLTVQQMTNPEPRTPNPEPRTRNPEPGTENR